MGIKRNVVRFIINHCTFNTGAAIFCGKPSVKGTTLLFCYGQIAVCFAKGYSRARNNRLATINIKANVVFVCFPPCIKNVIICFGNRGIRCDFHAALFSGKPATECISLSLGGWKRAVRRIKIYFFNFCICGSAVGIKAYGKRLLSLAYKYGYRRTGHLICIRRRRLIFYYSCRNGIAVIFYYINLESLLFQNRLCIVLMLTYNVFHSNCVCTAAYS